MMIRCFLIAAFLGFAWSSPVRAGDERAGQAQLRYESGMAHFNLQEWDAAIADWEQGYRLKPVPEFLFNMAQAYRKSNRPDKAIFFYQRYLNLAPNAANRAEVDRYIDAARAQMAATPPPAPAPKPPVATTPTPTPTPTPAAPSLSSSNALTARPTPRAKPVYKRGWFWATIGGVAVLAAGGVVLGVTLGSSHRQVLDPVVY